MGLRKPQALLFFVNMLFWMAVYVYVPRLSGYVRNDLSAPAALVGLVTGSYGITQMLLRLPLGILSDRLRRRKPFILAGAAVGIASALLMYCFFTSPGALLAGRLMAGLSVCAYVQITVLYASYCAESGNPMGYVTGSSSAGQLIAMLLGGFIAGAFGYRATFLAAAGFGLAALALAFLAPENRAGRTPATWAEIRGTLGAPLLIAASVLAVFTQAVNFGKGFVFVPSHAQSVYHATEMQLSYLSVLIILPTALFSPFTSSWLLPRIGIRATVAAGFLLQALSCAMVPLAGGMAGLYASQFITGLGYSLTFPSLMALSVAGLPDRKKATAMGFYQSVYSLGIFAGPWLTGLFTDGFGERAAFFGNAAVAVLAAAGALVFLAVTGRKEIASSK